MLQYKTEISLSNKKIVTFELRVDEAEKLLRGDS
jgi:hypothetical protein